MRRRTALAAAVVALFLLIFLASRPGGPEPRPPLPDRPPENSTYYLRAVPLDGVVVRQNQTRRGLIVDQILSDFYLPERGLFNTSFTASPNGSRDYGNDGPTIYGSPWTFDEHGSDVYGGFNAMIANSFLVEYERTRQPRLLRVAEGVARALHREFWDPVNRSYELVDRLRGQRGAVNDGLAGSLYLQLYEITGNRTYGGWARETFDGMVANYLPESGKLRCCVADGVLRNERYTRDGLALASLVYAYRVLGEPLYLERARAMADRYVADFYDPAGYFRNADLPDTNAEVGLGLLELYRLQPDPHYKEALLSVARYWTPAVLREKNSVYDGEWFIFYSRVAREFPELDPSPLPAVWAALDACWVPRVQLSPHSCRSESGPFYAVINAIALPGYLRKE